MKPFLTLAALALLCAACVSDSPIRLLGAHPLKTDSNICDSESGWEQYRGSLDISAARGYLIQFQMASDLQRITTSVGGDILATPDRNDFYANEIIYTYPSGSERVPVHFLVRAGAQEEKLNLDLLTVNASRALANQGIVDPLEFPITFEVSGKLASGQALKSNSVTYPITVFNSGFPGCPQLAPGVSNPRAANGPCGRLGGQDGTPPGCCFIAADGGMVPNPAFEDFCAGT